MAAPLLQQCVRSALGFLSLSKSSGPFTSQIREASKKAGSTTRNKRKNTPGKSRGPKKTDGQYVEKGMILVRQLGLRYYPGENVGVGKDLTLFAMEPGRVVVTSERLSPYPHSPLYPAVNQGRVIHKKFFNIISEPQEQVFKLVSKT